MLHTVIGDEAIEIENGALPIEEQIEGGEEPDDDLQQDPEGRLRYLADLPRLGRAIDLRLQATSHDRALLGVEWIVEGHDVHARAP